MVAQLLIARLLVRHAGLSGVGALATVGAIASLYGVVADLNVTPRMMRAIAVEPSSLEQTRWHLAAVAVWAAASIVLIVTTTCGAFLFGRLPFGLTRSALIQIAFAGCLSMLVQICALRAASSGLVGRQAAIAVGSSFSLIVAIAAVLRERDASVAHAFLLSSIFGAALSLVLTLPRQRSQLQRPSRHMVSSLTSSGLKLSAAAIAGAGALALQPLTVRVVLGSSPMGLVRIASTFSAAAIGLISILLSRWFLPLAIRDRRPGNRDRRPDAIGLISNLAGFFSLGVIAFGPFVITRFFGIGTRVAHQLTVLMAVGDSVRPLGVMFAMCLVAGGRDGTFTLLEVAFGVVYLALTATLGAVFGVIGVPIAYLLAYGLYTAVAAILVVRSGEFRNAVEAIRLAAAPVAACTAAGALSLLGGPSIGAAASAALLVVLAAVKKPWRVRTRLVQNPRHAPAAFV